MKRGYLLPPGCKDLSDVLKLKHKQVPGVFWKNLPYVSSSTFDTTVTFGKEPVALPPVKGEIVFPAGTTVKKLAALLGQTLAVINGDLMQLGILAAANFVLDFKTISKISRMHGFTAIKAAF